MPVTNLWCCILYGPLFRKCKSIIQLKTAICDVTEGTNIPTFCWVHLYVFCQTAGLGMILFLCWMLKTNVLLLFGGILGWLLNEAAPCKWKTDLRIWNNAGPFMLYSPTLSRLTWVKGRAKTFNLPPDTYEQAWKAPWKQRWLDIKPNTEGRNLNQGQENVEETLSEICAWRRWHVEGFHQKHVWHNSHFEEFWRISTAFCKRWPEEDGVFQKIQS